MLTLIDVDAASWMLFCHDAQSGCTVRYEAKRACALMFGIACMLDMHRLAMDRARGAAVIVATHHPRTGA